MSRHTLLDLPLNAYDLIHLDGSYQTIDVLDDAVVVFQLAKVGAIIAFDDHTWDAPLWNQWGAPKPATGAFLEIYILDHNAIHHWLSQSRTGCRSVFESCAGAPS